MSPQTGSPRILSVDQRRDIALPIAAQVLTMGHLHEFMSSETGKKYYNVVNSVLAWLAPGNGMQASAKFGQLCLADAKTVLMALPRETTPALMRFNASCRLFETVYALMGASDWNLPQIDAFRKANGNFIGTQKTILHVGDQPAINDLTTDAAADALFVGAKVRGRYAGIDTRIISH